MKSLIIGEQGRGLKEGKQPESEGGGMGRGRYV